MNDPTLKYGPAYIEGMQLKYERFQDNSLIRNLCSWQEGPTKQTNPPTIPIDVQFPDKIYPKNPEMPHHGDKSVRITQAEWREKDQINEE